MKKIVSILAWLLAIAALGQETLDIEQQINRYWTNHNYAAIIKTIDDALEKDPHNIFALCLKHGYYMSVEEDFDKAKESSSQFVKEVDTRIRNAGGAVYDLAKAIADMERPEAEPPQNLINPERMAYRHKESPSEFPFMKLYTWFCSNLDKYENMNEESQLLTAPFREPHGGSQEGE
jgi:hypothetical protein